MGSAQQWKNTLIKGGFYGSSRVYKNVRSTITGCEDGLLMGKAKEPPTTTAEFV